MRRAPDWGIIGCGGVPAYLLLQEVQTADKPAPTSYHLPLADASSSKIDGREETTTPADFRIKPLLLRCGHHPHQAHQDTTLFGIIPPPAPGQSRSVPGTGRRHHVACFDTVVSLHERCVASTSVAACFHTTSSGLAGRRPAVIVAAEHEPGRVNASPQPSRM